MNLTEAKPAIPTELHGFRVEIGIGPYPPHLEHSGQKAVYAKLHPQSPEIRERMAHRGRTMLVGALPVSPEMVTLINSGVEEATEYCALQALREASRLAKEIVD